MTYNDLIARSRDLPYSMPTDANRLERFADRRDEVEAHAAGVRPILHETIPPLIEAFLAHKRAVGSPVEQALYAELDAVGFVSRLLERRPLAFLNSSDHYLLRDGTEGVGGFEHVGTARETKPLVLEQLLSYDEMPISALLGVSVPTHFINRGDRYNEARIGRPEAFQRRGIYVGLVGARFERRGQMAWRFMRVTPEQNTIANGYGAEADPDAPETGLLRAWARFYGLDHLPTHAEAKAADQPRFLPLRGGHFLDTRVYTTRIRRVIEPFLLDANERAGTAGRRAYVHVVGLGLGVWEIHPRQTDLMLAAYADVLRERALPHIADLDFSWFRDATACGGVEDGDVLRAGDNAVRIHFSKRDPAARLEGDDAGKLLVAMYAWDSNAFPGNEYWLGALSASGDPAAACCSTIPELQNPDVNPQVAGQAARVYGAGEPRPLR